MRSSLLAAEELAALPLGELPELGESLERLWDSAVEREVERTGAHAVAVRRRVFLEAFEDGARRRIGGEVMLVSGFVAAARWLRRRAAVLAACDPYLSRELLATADQMEARA